MITSVFFTWGFMMTWNDLLIPRFKDAFTLSFFEAMLVQLAYNGGYFFGALAYYLLSVFGGDLIGKVGYKNGVVIGLGIAGIGAALFFPAAIVMSYAFFLAALFTIGVGFSLLQITANPYVIILGPERTASSRLNIAQGFASFGTTVGPIVGSLLIFGFFSRSSASGANAVKFPYVCCAIVFFLLALIFRHAKLPEFTNEEASFPPGLGALRHPHMVLGIVAIFLYVGAEVSIGSSIINFLGLKQIAGLSHAGAGRFLSFYWGGLMAGRFMGGFALSSMSQKLKSLLVTLVPLTAFGIAAGALGWANALHYAVCLGVLTCSFYAGAAKPSRMLTIFSLVLVAMLAIGILTTGLTAQWAILGTGLFCSIMWSNIFSLAIDGLGPLKSQASSLLIMAVLGAAVIPPLQGAVADHWGIQISFIVPMLSLAYVAFYGAFGHRAGRQESVRTIEDADSLTV